MRDAIFRSALCVHIAAIVVPFAVCVCVEYFVSPTNAFARAFGTIRLLLDRSLT